jgi:hypothetical protein
LRASRATRGLGSLLLAAALAGCGVSEALPQAGICREASPRISLPPEARESSGLAPAGASDPLLLWTHNDSGWPAELFLVDGEGALVTRVDVLGAANRDWEDLAAGPCPGEGGLRCLYIADTGDNLERRDDPAIYRVPEPAPSATASSPAARFPLVLPHGPRDVEALYLLPGERLFLITKGRSHPVEVYRVPSPLGVPGAPLLLERIQTLTSAPPWLPRMVTGAAATPEGDLVAVRTYETLEFYRPDSSGRLLPAGPGPVNLRTLREPQGEAVTFLPDGRIALSSEAGPGGGLGSMRFLECDLDG